MYVRRFCGEHYRAEGKREMTDRLQDSGAIMSLTDMCGAAVANCRLYP